MWKLVAALWLPASVVVTAVALANIYNHLTPDSTAWVPLFDEGLSLYGGTTKSLFTPLGDTFRQYAGFGVPPWASDLVVAYGAMASGIAFGGTNFTSREGGLYTLRSSAASAGWPLAILGFVTNAVRNRVVTRFATQHTALFVLYLAAVGLVIAYGIWGTDILAKLGA